MGAITSTTESWNNHKFSEVEAYIKEKLNEIYDPYNGHDYVEIGGVKWATMNIGANSVTDIGLYFSCGDTCGYSQSQIGSDDYKKYFSNKDYIFGNGTSNNSETAMTKYNNADEKNELELCDDAARMNWGGVWRMPSKENYAALSAATTSAWTTNYEGTGVSGYVFTDKTDSSKKLFFPGSGINAEGGISNKDEVWSWTRSFNPSDRGRAYHILLKPSSINWSYPNARFAGLVIRPVVE